jgi:hypothetical protein
MSQGRICSHVRPFNERAVSSLDMSLHRSLWAKVAHGLFIEGSYMTKKYSLQMKIGSF